MPVMARVFSFYFLATLIRSSGSFLAVGNLLELHIQNVWLFLFSTNIQVKGENSVLNWHLIQFDV